MTLKTTKRLAIGVATAGLATILFSPFAGAAGTLPTITLTGTARTVKLSGTGSLTAGPHTLAIKPGAKDRSVAIFLLKPGASAAKLAAAAAKLHGPPTSLQQYGAFVSGPTVGKHEPPQISLQLDPGDYVVLDTTNAPKQVGAFTVDSPAAQAGFELPKTSATIKLHDYKIDAPKTIEHGTDVEVVNDGPSPHFLTSAPVKSLADGAKVAADLKTGKEKAAQKLVTGGFFDYVGLLTPKFSNVVSLGDLKPGVYVLACFYADSRSKGKEHTMLGMEKVITVR